MNSNKNIISNKKIDLKDKYNYTLNGIEHQIPLNSNIIINSEPLNEKILISNKFLIKYLHDLFSLNSIDYFITYHTLLGYYVFEGINLFKKNIYLCISDHHLNKLLKLKEQIIKDDFIFEEKDNYYIIKTSFFDKIIVSSYIYIIKNDENKKLIHSINNIESILDFYDIYPLQEKNYEEFKIFIPNKIDNVLNSYLFNLNSIIFNSDSINELKNKKNNINNDNLFSNNTLIDENNNSTHSNDFDNSSIFFKIFNIFKN